MTEPSTPSDPDSDGTVAEPATDSPPEPSPDPFADPLVGVPGGYRTLAAALGLAGVGSLLHLALRGSWVRILALSVVALGARVLWARLRRSDGLGAAFSFSRATETTLLCAALAGFGVVQTSPLLGVIAAAAVFLASWLTSPETALASG